MFNAETIRPAKFMGRFYPNNSTAINQLLGAIVQKEEKLIAQHPFFENIIGGVVPHAGYVYSAYQAVHFYELLKRSKEHIETFIIINPNHTGYRNGDFNTCSFDAWETPSGNRKVDIVFRQQLGIEQCNAAHSDEHSAEVQLPMLNYFFSHDFQVLPITLNRQNLKVARELAQRIFEIQKSTGRKIMIIASSDFSHFETPENGFQQDQFVVDEILKLNSKGIYQQVKKHNVTTCGFGAVMTLIEYSKLATENPQIKLLRRGHSGEVSPSKEVVDYISFLLSYA